MLVGEGRVGGHSPATVLHAGIARVIVCRWPAPSRRAARSTRSSTRSRRTTWTIRSPSCARCRSSDAPVFYAPSIDYYVVTRYEDIEAIFLDHETFSAAAAQLPLAALSPEAAEFLLGGGHRPQPSMVSLDQPEHTRLRRHTARAFTPRRVAAMEGTIRTTVERAARRGRSGATPFDLVASLTFPLPATIVFTLIGVPPEDYGQLKRWCGYRAGLDLRVARRPRSRSRTRRTSWPTAATCAGWSHERVERRTADLTSALIDIHDEDPEALTLEEIASILLLAELRRPRDDELPHRQRHAAPARGPRALGARSSPNRRRSRAPSRRRCASIRRSASGGA